MLKEFALRYLNTGVRSENEPEVNRQIFVANLFSFIGYSITFVLGAGAFFRSNYYLALALLLASALFYYSHAILKFPQIKNAYKISRSVVLISLLILVLYLVVTGGHKNTGPLWIYIVPPVVFFFGGLRRGVITLSLFVISVSLVLFFPNEALVIADYPHEFKTRVLYSFMTVASLFAFYEYSRQKSYKDIQELSSKFELQARQDPLTMLPNRRGMREHLEYEYNRSVRSQRPMALLLCDIDYFKKVNDNYGHDTGDNVLKQISDAFNRVLRKQDIVSRWGGEEFLFLLPETSGNDAYILAEKIRENIHDHEFEYNGKRLHLTISIGVCEVNQHTSVDDAINRSDHYLYQAKELGRNQTSPSPEV
jgi:diguanylate cyclase (GGDEF)-like protein